MDKNGIVSKYVLYNAFGSATDHDHHELVSLIRVIHKVCKALDIGDLDELNHALLHHQFDIVRLIHDLLDNYHDRAFTVDYIINYLLDVDIFDDDTDIASTLMMYEDLIAGKYLRDQY
jgi:hypothetical protein